MPTIFIPFRDFQPDKGKFLNPGLVTGSKNFLAMHGLTISAPQPEFIETIVSGDAPLSAISAVHVHLFGLTDWRAYMGDGQVLYEFDPTGPTVTDVSRLAGGAYNSSGWFYTSFGDSILATNLADDVQLLTSGSANFVKNFATGDNPKARYIAAFRSHIVLGNYTLGGTAVPHGILWTATDNPQLSGTPSANPGQNTDRQPLLDDLGAVNGLAAGREYLLIFRDKGITRMDGPFDQPIFATLDLQASCRWPRSIVQYGDDTYFLTDGAVKVVRGGSVVEDIGDGQVNRFIFDSALAGNKIYDDPAPNFGPSGAADPGSNQIVWSWRGSTEAGATVPSSHMVAYNPSERRWSYFEPFSFGEVAGDAARGLAFKPRTGDAWTKLGNLLFLGNNVASGAEAISLYKFNSDGGSNLSPTLATGYFQHYPGVRSRTKWVRPIVRNDNAGISLDVRVVTKANPWGAAVASDKTVLHSEADGTGHIYMPPDHVPEEFTSYELTATDLLGSQLEIEGLEVFVEEAGATFAK